MKQPALSITTGAVLVVAILALVAIAMWAPPDTRTELLSSTGILASIALAAMRALWTRRRPDAAPDDRTSSERTARTLTIPIAIAIAIAAGPALACSPSQIEAHAEVGAALNDIAIESAHVVRAWRTDEMRAAARAVHDSGGSLEDAQAAARRAGADAAPVVEAQRLYALSASAYIDAALLAARSADGLQPGDVLPAVRDVLDTWRHLRRLGSTAGIDFLAALPDLPPMLDGLMPPQLLAGALEAPTTGGDGGAR